MERVECERLGQDVLVNFRSTCWGVDRPPVLEEIGTRKPLGDRVPARIKNQNTIPIRSPCETQSTQEGTNDHMTTDAHTGNNTTIAAVTELAGLGLTVERMDRALRAVRRVLPPTPLLPSPILSDLQGCPVYLKVEAVTPTRSFKVRGALARVAELDAEGDTRPLLTASAGNHGLGVAYAGRISGRPVTVYVPEGANRAKVAALRAEGATVVAGGHDYAEAAERANQAAVSGGYAYVHPFDDPGVIAGQGTIATEILNALGKVAAIAVPVGGGGLLGGIAATLCLAGSRTRIYGVEAKGADAMARSRTAHTLITLESVDTIADGLAPRGVSARTLALAEHWVDDILLVDDPSLLAAMHHVLVRERLLVEPAGAAAVAACLQGLIPPGSGTHADEGPCVLIVSGGNVTEDLLHKALLTPLPGQ